MIPPLLWEYKLHKKVLLSKLHSGYIYLSQYISVVITIKLMVTGVINSLGLELENINIKYRSTVYEDSQGALRVEKSQTHVNILVHSFKLQLVQTVC